MRHSFYAVLLSAAVACTGTAMAQMDSGKGTSSPTGSNLNSVGGVDSGVGADRTTTTGTPGLTITPSSTMNPSTPSADSKAVSTNGQTQVEGKLVDLLSISGSTAAMGGSTTPQGVSTSSNSLSTGAASPGSSSGSATGTTGTTGTITPTGETSGTYSRPGASVGSGGAASNLANSSDTNALGNTTGNGAALNTSNSGSSAGKGSVAVTGSSAMSGAAGSYASSAQQLTAGIPAALQANGQTYVLVCDPRQLSMYAGQTVRITGRSGSQNVLIPDKMEVKQAGGNFREVTFTKPMENRGMRTAQEQ